MVIIKARLASSLDSVNYRARSESRERRVVIAAHKQMHESDRNFAFQHGHMFHGLSKSPTVFSDMSAEFCSRASKRAFSIRTGAECTERASGVVV